MRKTKMSQTTHIKTTQEHMLQAKTSLETDRQVQQVNNKFRVATLTMLMTVRNWRVSVESYRWARKMEWPQDQATWTFWKSLGITFIIGSATATKQKNSKKLINKKSLSYHHLHSPSKMFTKLKHKTIQASQRKHRAIQTMIQEINRTSEAKA